MLAKSFVALVLILGGSLPSWCQETKDKDSLNGTWLPQKMELGGIGFPEEVRKSIKLVVKDDKYTVTAGKGLDQGTVKINAGAKPKTMDIIGVEGPNKGKTFLAIWELDGDTLRVCYDLTGTSRPTEFKSPEGSQLFLVTYLREK
jgi:uncharacterized protein (TIGR03067 family)